MKIINVAGARPNFVKIAPLTEAFRATGGIDSLLVHTGQHYDEWMSQSFFRQFEIPEPDVNLEVGSASHAVQTAEIMRAFEPVLLEHKPDAVLVVGDVNSTIACGLVAAKLAVKLVHVEAGLRSFDRTMPEEINRLLTDAISDLLLCSEPSGVENLRNEGVAEEKIFLVGNVMIDALVKNRPKADKSNVLERLSLGKGQYAVLTLHRPANVDDPLAFGWILDALEIIQQELPVIFPVHPRTRKNLDRSPLGRRVEQAANLRLIEPAGYLDFLKLTSSAKAVLTDSGGIQEETTFLGIPCITLRPNTARPITTEIGSSRLVGADTEKIIEAWDDVRAGRWQVSRTPELWDGHAAGRIAEILVEKIR